MISGHDHLQHEFHAKNRAVLIIRIEYNELFWEQILGKEIDCHEDCYACFVEFIRTLSVPSAEQQGLIGVW